MSEYIEREAALDVVKRTSGDYVAAWSEIAHMPAADVAEVRHGRWIKHEGYDECGLCHAKTIYGGNYCPSCGALMDKEADHETD